MKIVSSILVLIVILAILIALYYVTKKRKVYDDFQPWEQDRMDSYVNTYENSHGSKPPGLTDILGRVQQQQNANALHVSAANKDGNPQNTMAEFKRQPNVQ
jgi:uncharacterized protein YxeA